MYTSHFMKVLFNVGERVMVDWCEKGFGWCIGVVESITGDRVRVHYPSEGKHAIHDRAWTIIPYRKRASGSDTE